MDPDFRAMDTVACAADYGKAKKRVLLIDYDGTLVQAASYDVSPDAELLSHLTALAADPRNAAVCVVSGRERKQLDNWFRNVPGIALLAEHGFWYKPPDWSGSGSKDWQMLVPAGTEETIKRWREIVEPILDQYHDATDGSLIRDKGTSMIWDYRDADPDFGQWQAKELMDHLESVLVNEQVDVFPGHNHVEIKAHGVSKATPVEMFLGENWEIHLRPESEGATPGKVDFVMAIGDDRSDEEMFMAVDALVLNPEGAVVQKMSCPMPGKEKSKGHEHLSVYCVTVGQKPSKADFYLDDSDDVVQLVRNFTATGQSQSPST